MSRLSPRHSALYEFHYAPETKFASFLMSEVNDGEVARNLVARVEAEGARLIGAALCTAGEDPITGRPLHEFWTEHGRPCPTCGAVV